MEKFKSSTVIPDDIFSITKLLLYPRKWRNEAKFYERGEVGLVAPSCGFVWEGPSVKIPGIRKAHLSCARAWPSFSV